MAFTKLIISIVCAIALASISAGAPARLSFSTMAASTSRETSSASTSLAGVSTEEPSTSTLSAPPVDETVAPASEEPNFVAWTPGHTGTPEPMHGSLGSNIIGPQNEPLELQNPSIFAPPTTDHGSVGNVKWPFSLSPNRLQTGGWARQQNSAVLPLAKKMAGVDMRLEAGAIRELHWHTASEWAYVLKGSMQVTAVDQLGRNFVGTANAGDLWFFPPGIPHSLQATNATGYGSEFLLVMDSGDFDENGTFLLTDWLSHVPKEVLAKNFQTSVSAFNKIPGEELYIFPAPAPGLDSDHPTSPYGMVDQPYTFAMSQMPVTQLSGGSVKIVDSHIFNISTTTAVAEVTVEPGAMRELHWHPTEDEWTYFIEGNARVTIFAAQSNAQTFDFQGGDVGYIPAANGHYVENTGNTTLRFLEVFKTDTFQDISLAQWLALIPTEMVKETLNLDDETISHISKVKQIVVGPVKSTSTSNSTTT